MSPLQDIYYFQTRPRELLTYAKCAMGRRDRNFLLQRKVLSGSRLFYRRPFCFGYFTTSLQVYMRAHVLRAMLLSSALLNLGIGSYTDHFCKHP